MRNLNLISIIDSEWSQDAKKDNSFTICDQKAKDNIMFNLSENLKRFVRS